MKCMLLSRERERLIIKVVKEVLVEKVNSNRL